jgi:hypothetical protein
MKRVIASILALSFITPAFAKREADEGRNNPRYGNETGPGELPDAPPFHVAMAMYGLKAKDFPRLQAIWGKVAFFILGVLAERYLGKGLDKLEPIIISSVQDFSAMVEATADAFERDRIIRDYSDGDISNGEYDWVGPHPGDNTASPERD